MRRVLFVLLAMMAALLPASAFADDGATDNGGFVLRVTGDYWLRSGETVDSVVVIDGHARIDGMVHSSLIVFSGSATVTGAVEGDITMFGSDLDLQGTAVVNNVAMFRGDLTRAGAATITGDLDESSGYFLWNGWGIIFGILMMVGMTIFVIAAGLLFAGVGGGQLVRATESMSAEPGKTIAAGLVTVIGVPVLAILAVITIVGIPIAAGMILMVIPLLGLLGHLVAGTWLGSLLLRRTTRPEHPYAEAALGLLLLQVLMFVPGVGALAFLLGMVWGTGAVTLMAWRGIRRGGKPTATTTPTAIGGGVPHPA